MIEGGRKKAAFFLSYEGHNAMWLFASVEVNYVTQTSF